MIRRATRQFVVDARLFVGKLVVGRVRTAFGKLVVDVVANLDHDVAITNALDEHGDDHRLFALFGLVVGRQRRPDGAGRRIARPDRQRLVALARTAATGRPIAGMFVAWRQALVRMPAFDWLLQCDDRPIALWHGSS
jgi:hypothetical protein